MFFATAGFKVNAACALHAGRERVPGYNWEINHVNTSPYFDSCHRHDEPDLGEIGSPQLNRMRITRGNHFTRKAQGFGRKKRFAKAMGKEVYPTIRECSHDVDYAVIKCAVSEGHADQEVLEKLNETVKNAMWFPEYVPVRCEKTL